MSFSDNVSEREFAKNCKSETVEVAGEVELRCPMRSERSEGIANRKKNKSNDLETDGSVLRELAFPQIGTTVPICTFYFPQINCINCVNDCEDHSLLKWVPCSIYVYVRWEFVGFPHCFAEQVYCSVLSTTFVSRRLKYISNGIHPTYAHRPFYSRVLSCLAYE